MLAAFATANMSESVGEMENRSGCALYADSANACASENDGDRLQLLAALDQCACLAEGHNPT